MYQPAFLLTPLVSCGEVLQQRITNMWCPLAYFSWKRTSAQQKYSTFDCELLSIYLSLKHFHYFVEGHKFYIVTDHKPLTFAFKSRSSTHLPRQACQLDYISQFTSGIHYLPGNVNAAADALSHMDMVALACPPASTSRPWPPLNRQRMLPALQGIHLWTCSPFLYGPQMFIFSAMLPQGTPGLTYHHTSTNRSSTNFMVSPFRHTMPLSTWLHRSTFGPT